MKKETAKKSTHTPIKIGAFDSGKGGLSIMLAVQDLLPNEDYYFIPDSANCPYGDKSTKELQEITEELTESLIDWGAEIIVVACNTATVKCIDHLRKKYPEVDFVGTEPAVKVAARSKAKNIMVLATPGTIRSERLEKTIAESKKPDQTFTLIPCKGLAEAIEEYAIIDDEHGLIISTEGILAIHEIFRRNLIDANLTQKQLDPDLIVLGCTHYPLVEKLFHLTFENVKCIDGSDGVARQVKKLVEEKRTKKSEKA